MSASNRYAAMFARLAQRNEGAFVPFAVLGDPDPALSLEVLRALVRGGADALELGIPFSDPVADGPTIQAANGRALAAGTKPSHAWSLIRALRQESPDIPIGLLVYANLVEARGREIFYQNARACGVDSVLVADVPTLEADAYVSAALAAEILPVLIATPTASKQQLQRIARLSQGYVYVVTRAGVTGTEQEAQLHDENIIKNLRQEKSAPPLLGFGISSVTHVRRALEIGASGAISGSAVVKRIEQYRNEPQRLTDELEHFCRDMKAATARAGG